MNTLIAVACFFVAANAAYIGGPSTRVVQGPSTKTAVVGPGGEVISAVAPGGRIVQEEYPGVIAESGYAGQPIYSGGPAAYSNLGYSGYGGNVGGGPLGYGQHGIYY